MILYHVDMSQMLANGSPEAPDLTGSAIAEANIETRLWTRGLRLSL